MGFRENGGRPGDERGFIHKKFLRVAAKFGGAIPLVGGIVKTVATALTGDQQKDRGRNIKLGNGTALVPTILGTAGGCPDGMEWSVLHGQCIVSGAKGKRERFFPGGATGFGNAVIGQYGAALEPGSMMIDRAVCPRGTQLANDGLCYNKGQITNKQRMWPAGRKPLLTGGDMRAISIASRAGRRMELTTKRLQKMGMMRKPARRAVPAGHRAKLVHNEH